MSLNIDLSHHTKYVALKVQKSADHYTEAARDEIDLLQTIRANAGALKEHASKHPRQGVVSCSGYTFL